MRRCGVQTIVRGSTWSPPPSYGTSPTHAAGAPSVAQSNRLQPGSNDYTPPSYRQPPARYPDTAGPYGQYPAGPDQPPYRGPPSDIVDRRDYRDLPEYGRNGFRGNGSLPRDSSLQYRRPPSAQSDQYHPHPPYMTSSPRGPGPLPQPQYSNGSYNGPAVMESPPRPGMNRGRDEADDRERQYQQTVSANQQYERVSGAYFKPGFHSNAIACVACVA